ncbi:MAG: threonylcarbamoyl-AMP synthase [Gammaproteobacteria bacterium]|nr:threonylcarbamoyl-AMP synthase [Gammaproteobacteria bacterium]
MVNPWKIKQAANVVLSGGIIAYPTEAVYGLGCNPLISSAVIRLLQLKHRPMEKGLILVAADILQLKPFITIPSNEILRKITESWPGPVTWVLPAKPGIPPTLTGAHQTLAVRVSAHPLVQALCREIDQPLVSTSANQESAPPARSALAVRRFFGQEIDFILHGTVNLSARPTEIRDALTDKVLRAG